MKESPEREITLQNHLVSVGLPVYNGEAFLSEAIESILSQTHENLELILSDNASTDQTREICEYFAHQDRRVRFYSHSENRGAASNFNFVLDSAKGSFFKWMAHDDVCRPRFIEACLEALLADQEAVLAYPTPIDIGEDGELLSVRDSGLGFDHPDPVERFRRTMARAHACLPVFGLTRTFVVQRTCKHGDYPAADRVLIGELALLGPLIEVPEPLFLHREHAHRFSIAHKTIESQIAWFDPSRATEISLPVWRRLHEYLRAIGRAPLNARQKAACGIWMLRWSIDLRAGLLSDLARVVKRLLLRSK